MIGLVLDTLVLMVLIRVITGDENEGWVKPACIALISSIGLVAADIAATNAPESVLLILIGAVAGVGIFIALCCMLLLDINFSKSALIAVGFIVYKTIFLLAFVFAFSAGG